MPIQDRTVEFRACVDSIRHRTVAPLRSRDSEAKQRLIGQRRNEANKSEFAQMAGGINKDIAGTVTKLDKLAQRMSR